MKAISFLGTVIVLIPFGICLLLCCFFLLLMASAHRKIIFNKMAAAIIDQAENDDVDEKNAF